MEKKRGREEIAFLAGVGVAALVTVAVLITGSDVDPREAREPQMSSVRRGVACPGLARAVAAQQAGNEQEFAAAVREAERASTRALDESGQVFGTAEELALNLQHAYEENGLQSAQVDRLLERAQATCRELGRWPHP